MKEFMMFSWAFMLGYGVKWLGYEAQKIRERGIIDDWMREIRENGKKLTGKRGKVTQNTGEHDW